MQTITVNFMELLLTVFGTLVASSGFWMWLERRNERKSLGNQLLMGLAHDRILDLGMKYVQRGWITQDEYENLSYLYNPYKKMGGNGSGNRIMCEVDKLPIRENRIVVKEPNCQ